MKKLTLITSLIRPQNLLRLQSCIENTLGDAIPWQWIVVADGKFVPGFDAIPPLRAHVLFRHIPIPSYGFLEKNEALNIIEEDSWIYFQDDDTEMHPGFRDLFLRSLEENQQARGMVFGQVLPDGNVRAPQAGLDNYVGKIDMCQYVLRRSAIGQHRFFAAFGCDGEFFNRVYRENRESFVFKSEVGFYHNNIRPGEKWDPQTGYGRPY